MRKITEKKESRVPIWTAFNILKITKRRFYQELSRGIWRDGYIVRKHPDTSRWQWFIIEEYMEWQNMTTPPLGFEAYVS